MSTTTILGVKLSQRVNTATDFQAIITKHGCSIKTRLGLHPVSDGVCSPSGIILLEVISEVEPLIADIKAIPGSEVQQMIFNQ